MKIETTFSSNQYSVSDLDVKKAYEQLGFYGTYGVKDLKLYDIETRPSGHGHYKVAFIFEADGKEIKFKVTTSDMTLIDGWSGLMGDDDFENTGTFDGESHVISAMLGLADSYLEDKLDELN